MSPELPYSPLALPLPVTKTDHKYLNIQCSFIMEPKHVPGYLIFDFFISAFVSSKNVSVVRCSYIKEQF